MAESQGPSASSPRPLPPRANLEQLKKQAKERLGELRRGDPTAKLADAQLAIAREYGFTSWRALKAHVDALAVESQQQAASSRAAAANAVKRGDARALAQVLDADPQAIHAGEGLWGGTLLHQAAWNGDVAIIDLLLARGFDVNTPGGDNALALHFAAEAGRFEAVKRLVEAGSDVNHVADEHELGPIGWATHLNLDEQIAAYLIEQGAHVHIFAAIAMGRADLVRQIIEADPSQLERPMAACEGRRRPLHLAVAKNQPEIVKLLLESGADAAVRDASGHTPLALLPDGADPVMREGLVGQTREMGFAEALATERFDLAERLLRDDPARLKAGGQDEHALYRAAAAGRANVVRWLIAHGGDVNGRIDEDCHQTVLHAAAHDDRLDVIRVLLEAGVDPTLRDERWNATPASWAGYANQKQAEALLSEAEAKARQANEQAETDDQPAKAAVEAASTGDHAALAAILDAHPEAIEATGGTWDQPLLHLAASKGHLDVVNLLLERGFDVNTRDEGDNAYALHFAAGDGRLDVVKRLVEAGGDIHGEGDDHEMGVLGWATCLGGYHEDVARFLLERGARHHIFSAVAMDDEQMVRKFVEADPAQLDRRMSRNEHHRRPLHHAVVKNRPAMVALLLELGADAHQRDESGATPLTYAAEGADEAMLALLQEAGVQMDVRGALRMKRYDLAEALVREDPARIGPTGHDTIALHLCTFHNDADGVRWLIEHGVDINAKRVLWNCNHTALHVAVEHERLGMAQLLLGAGADPGIRDDKYESTALGWAEYLGRPELAELIRQWEGAK